MSHKRLPTALLVLSFLGCAHAGAPRGTEQAAAPNATTRRHLIVPLVEHHQHIAGPEVISMVALPPSLPAASLPPELQRLLRDRERISGSDSIGDVYTADAQILDVSEAEDHWMRGEEALRNMVAAYTPDSRFVANTYRVDGTTGFIAGVVRSEGSSNDDMNFTFGVQRGPDGRWRIAVESATNLPRLAFGKPITAERTIQVLDDAGIGRAAVLSVAFWLGDGSLKLTSDEEYARVKRENDWVAEQVSRYPTRLVAFCGVNPLREYAIREIERCARLPLVKGMKIHFANSRVDVRKPAHVEQLRRFFRAANDNGMAIVAHLWTTDRSYGAEHSRIFLDRILPEAPDVPVQIAHLAGAGRYAHDDALAVFADAVMAKDPRMRRVYFDLATVVTETQSDSTLALIARRLRQVGLDRVLFGADTPTFDRPAPLQAWATTRRRLPLTDDEIGTIANNVAPYMQSP